MTFSKKTELFLLLALLATAAVLRLYNVSHGQGIHPDERHMIMVAEKLSLADMNPHSFAYGSFPYYLLWFSSRLASLFSDQLVSYDGLFLVGRVLCATMGILGVLLLYFLSLKLYNDFAISISAAALLAFNVFHLQLSRFYTVDVILTTLVLATVLALVELYRSRDLASYIAVGFFFGLALATKVSALFLLAPIGATLLLLLFYNEASLANNIHIGISRQLLLAIMLAMVTLLTFVTIQPYSVMDNSEFIKQVREQTSMVQGLWRPPYTIQYEHTMPYFYHLRQIFLFTMGWPLALATGLGIVACIRRQFRRLHAEELILLALIIPTFLVFGRYQVKFPRYLLPLYPVSILLGSKLLLDFARRSSAAALSYSSGSGSQLNDSISRKFQPLNFSRFSLSLSPEIRKYLYTALWACALFFALVTISLNSVSQSYFPTSATWALSISAALAALYAHRPVAINRSTFLQNTNVYEAVCVIMALTLGLCFRTYDLTSFPIQLHNDEMSCGLAAQEYLGPTTPSLFGVSWLTHPSLGFFLTSLPMHIWGEGLLGLRASAVVFGMLSLMGGYLLVRLLFDKRIALITLILNASFHFHLHFSRAGFHNMEATALIVWTLALFVRAYQRRELFFYGLSGVLFGLCLQTYPSAFLVPVVLAMWLALQRSAERKHVKQLAIGVSAFVGLALITYAPQLWYFIQHPETFAARARSVWIFADSNKEHVMSVVGSTDFWQIIKYQIMHALRFFIPGTDTSLQYGFKDFLFDPFIILPTIAGIALALYQLKQSGHQLILITILGVYFCAGVLTIDPPFAPRYTPLSPLLMIFPALFLAKLCGEYSDRLTKVFLRLLFYLILGASTYWNLSYYFGTYSNRSPVERRDYIVRLATDLGDIKSIINLFSVPEDFEYESYRFMIPGVAGLNIGPDKAASLDQTLLAESLKDSEKPALIIAPEEQPVLQLLASQIKSNRIGSVHAGPGREFNWYVIP